MSVVTDKKMYENKVPIFKLPSVAPRRGRVRGDRRSAVGLPKKNRLSRKKSQQIPLSNPSPVLQPYESEISKMIQSLDIILLKELLDHCSNFNVIDKAIEDLVHSVPHRFYVDVLTTYIQEVDEAHSLLIKLIPPMRESERSRFMLASALLVKSFKLEVLFSITLIYLYPVYVKPKPS